MPGLPFWDRQKYLYVPEPQNDFIFSILCEELGFVCAAPEVHVVDSKNVTIGQGILVQYALRLADEGRGAAEIASMVESARERLVLLALLDPLEYLRRGGRIPKSVGAIGELLSIKPVIGVRDGEVVMLGKARGSKNGRNLLHQEVEKNGIDFSMPALIGYSGLSDKLLRKYLEDNRVIWEDKVAEDPNYKVRTYVVYICANRGWKCWEV